MVALAPNTFEPSPWDVLNSFPKLHSRAREAKTQSCTEAPHSKSLSRVEIWQAIFGSCDGLESFTRDPIGYEGSRYLLYRYVKNSPLRDGDPMGLLDAGTATVMTCAAAEEAGIIGAGVGAGGVALCGVTFVGGVGVGYCIGYYPAQWKCERDCKVHLQKINIKKGKWRCTAKARNWNKGTPCYDQIYDGDGKSESDAYDAAWQACVDAGCHQPGRGGDCGHVTCFQKP